MNTAVIRLLQRKLAEAGLFRGQIDGRRSDALDVAAAAFLAATARRLPDDWTSWPGRRKAVGCLQVLCHDAGIDAGPVDGWWGPQTEFAVGSLATLTETGAMPSPWRDRDAAPRANPNSWPGRRRARSMASSARTACRTDALRRWRWWTARGC